MRKNYLLLLLILFCTSTFAQNVPNPGFEDWTNDEPDFWTTNNQIPVATTVMSTNVAHSGSLAARCEVIGITGGSIPPSLICSSNTGDPGFPISTAFQSLDFWYQSSFVNTDALIVAVYIYDSGSSLIGAGDVQIETNTSGYTFMSIPINYGPGVPAFAMIQFIVLDLSGMSSGSAGTNFLVDDIEFAGTTSIADVSRKSELSIYPNPASKYFNLVATVIPGETSSVRMSDLTGRVMMEKKYQPASGGMLAEKINVENFPTGIYMLTLTSDKRSITKRVVVR